MIRAPHGAKRFSFGHLMSIQPWFSGLNHLDAFQPARRPTCGLIELWTNLRSTGSAALASQTRCERKGVCPSVTMISFSSDYTQLRTESTTLSPALFTFCRVTCDEARSRHSRF